MDRVAADSERHDSPTTVRFLFYDTTPSFSWTMSGVELEIDRNDRLVRTWHVVE